jgi:ribosomal 50S subunit-recycling heat shock protein
MDNVRIDKWLWAARFFKTRNLAIDAIDSGKVKINGDRVKPARLLKLGEKLYINNGSDEWDVLVVGLSDQRQGAPIPSRAGACSTNRPPTSRAGRRSATGACATRSIMASDFGRTVMKTGDRHLFFGKLLPKQMPVTPAERRGRKCMLLPQGNPWGRTRWV